MADRDEKGRFLTGTHPGPGRTCGYDPAMDEQAYKLSLLGLTDEKMAYFFGISRNTLHRWKVENPGFRDAVQRGKEIADAEVAHALFKRAVGLSVKSEKAMKGGNGEIVITQTIAEVPPDTKAAIHWLQLRRRREWSEFEENDKGQPTPDAERSCLTQEDIRAMSNEELEERIRVHEERRRLNQNQN